MTGHSQEGGEGRGRVSQYPSQIDEDNMVCESGSGSAIGGLWCYLADDGSNPRPPLTVDCIKTSSHNTLGVSTSATITIDTTGAVSYQRGPPLDGQGRMSGFGIFEILWMTDITSNTDRWVSGSAVVVMVK